MIKFSNVAFVLLSLFFNFAKASEVIVNTVDLGWYQGNGTHRSDNLNTFTGYSSSVEYRSFYVWQLPALNGIVTSARIDFLLPYPLGSVHGSYVGEMYDVMDSSMPFLRLNNGGGYGVDIFNDLGSGVHFGDVDVPYIINSTDYPYMLSVQLNSNAVDAINLASDDYFALGMKNRTVSSNGYFLLSSGSVRGVQNLVLTIAPVPEPNTTSLLSIGLLLSFLYVGRCRKHTNGVA